MGVQEYEAGPPPAAAITVGPTSPGTALTLLMSGAQSETSGTPSLSSSGSTQSARPSPSVSRNPSSTTPLQLSSMPLQISFVGPPGTHCWICPPTQVITVLAHAPTPHVVVPSPSSTDPSQSSSIPLQVSAAGGPGVQL